MPPNHPIVVFSEMDGVVSASAPPAFAAAARTLNGFAREDVALVFCSSRTRAELEHIWQQQLGGGHPFIAECGSSSVFVLDQSFAFDPPTRAISQDMAF
jgi:mannosyl-3-phosphoglycerate phosphatase